MARAIPFLEDDLIKMYVAAPLKPMELFLDRGRGLSDSVPSSSFVPSRALTDEEAYQLPLTSNGLHTSYRPHKVAASVTTAVSWR